MKLLPTSFSLYHPYFKMSEMNCSCFTHVHRFACLNFEQQLLFMKDVFWFWLSCAHWGNRFPSAMRFSQACPPFQEWFWARGLQLSAPLNSLFIFAAPWRYRWETAPSGGLTRKYNNTKKFQWKTLHLLTFLLYALNKTLPKMCPFR